MAETKKKSVPDKDSGGATAIVPRHIAVIPDGNRRWARKRMLPVAFGHREGVQTYRRLLSHCGDLGVKYVTFYAFSTENWKRTADEVGALMSIFLDYIKNFDKVMGKDKKKVRFIITGIRDGLSPEIQQGIAEIEEETKDNTDLIAIICINYGGRLEITEAVKSIAEQVKEGKLSPSDITEDTVSANMFDSFADIPDPDLLIRTSGEQRISNFLLWQLAYSEFYFADCLWPDFDEKELDKAIAEFNHRQRRYGN